MAIPIRRLYIELALFQDISLSYRFFGILFWRKFQGEKMNPLTSKFHRIRSATEASLGPKDQDLQQVNSSLTEPG